MINLEMKNRNVSKLRADRIIIGILYVVNIQCRSKYCVCIYIYKYITKFIFFGKRSYFPHNISCDWIDNDICSKAGSIGM